MKKNQFRKNILLGMTSGLLAIAQGDLSAVEDKNTIDAQSLIAKAKCKGAHGCAAELIASSDENSGQFDDVDGLQDIDDSFNPEDSANGKKKPVNDAKNKSTK